MKLHLSPAYTATAILGIIIFLSGCDEQDETTVTDIDGNVYHTVVIGKQVWMAENLKTTHYRNGDLVPDVADSKDWDELFSGAWCDISNQYTNTGATNETGFSGLPGGSRQQNGPFWYFGYYGLWWTSTAENSEFAFYRSLSFDNTALFRNHFPKGSGLSIRCIKGNV